VAARRLLRPNFNENERIVAHDLEQECVYVRIYFPVAILAKQKPDS
jgi:hypothetical protein